MPKGTSKECPKCGARVRAENLRRHMNRVHKEGGSRTKAPPPRIGPSVTFPWRGVAALATAGAVVFAGYWLFLRPPSAGPTGSGPIAVIETNFGVIRVELDSVRAPGTASHFMALASEGGYDGTSFHRVAANFVIQGGQIPGAPNVAWEDTGLRNLRYTIAMARSGSADDPAFRDTATSQFFINLRDNASLDAYQFPYVVFGRVVAGQEVVDQIGSLYPAGQTGYDGGPTSPVTILRVQIIS